MRLGSKWILALSLVLLLTIVGGRAQESPPTEYQVKAAFLFNFAKFIDWPPDAFPNAASPFVIGVTGENPFGDELNRIVRDKTINGRPIMIRTVHSADEAKSCHILFISTSEKPRLREIFDGLQGASVLTISETDDFTRAGGMINFVIVDKKIRFQINDDAAKKARLKISSRLLSLALPSARS